MDTSFIDGLSVVFGKGADTAGRKAKVIALQGKIAQLDTSKKGLFADLGRLVFEQERGNASFEAVYSEQVQALLSLEQEQASLRTQIEELQRSNARGVDSVSAAPTEPVATVPTGVCPDCGAATSVDADACPSCGGNLAALKTCYRVCPKCGTYYRDDEAVFCIKCGSKVEELPVKESIPADSSPEPALETEPASESTPGPQKSTCPRCGAPVKPADKFCGECGKPLRE